MSFSYLHIDSLRHTVDQMAKDVEHNELEYWERMLDEELGRFRQHALGGKIRAKEEKDLRWM